LPQTSLFPVSKPAGESSVGQQSVTLRGEIFSKTRAADVFDCCLIADRLIA
jgi:hypothetical protein